MHKLGICWQCIDFMVLIWLYLYRYYTEVIILWLDIANPWSVGPKLRLSDRESTLGSQWEKMDWVNLKRWLLSWHKHHSTVKQWEPKWAILVVSICPELLKLLFFSDYYFFLWFCPVACRFRNDCCSSIYKCIRLRKTRLVRKGIWVMYNLSTLFICNVQVYVLIPVFCSVIRIQIVHQVRPLLRVLLQ